VADTLTLTDPPAHAPTFRVAQLKFGIRGAPSIYVEVAESVDGKFVPEGKMYVGTYSGAEATQLMQTLNTANLTTKSLQKRVLEKLQADGKLPPGTVD
jgi:hypothetical protein